MLPGKIVDQRFVIDRLVARGGMAAVHRAHDRQSGAEVAIKVWNGVGDNADRFEREARLLERLDHPAIVRYVAHGATPEGELYLAMEWLEGVDLGDRLSSDGLTIAESVNAIVRAADGLASAHTMGVVHRDLKPSNLFLVDSDPARLKVLDFGVARVREVDVKRPETHGGVVLGTPDYMSPEQARGDRSIDARADVFSLGAVLFECLTGRSAFSGNDLMAVLTRVMLEEVPRVRTLRPEVPAALDELVAQMLEKDAAARPASAAEVAARLRALGPLEKDREAVVSSRPRLRALRRELHLTSIVALRGGDDAERAAHTLAAGSAPGARSHLANVARMFGVRTATLDDGTITLIVRHGAAIDRAPHAARCALALADPRGALAVVTGPCALDGDRLDTTELTARAHGLARNASGSILVDDTTRALLDLRFEVKRSPAAFALCSERHDMHDLRARVTPPLPFVGRERALAAIDAVRDECERESITRVVVLTAGAGVGKSRMFGELVSRGRGETLSARGEAISCATPLSLARMLLCAAGIDAQTPEVERTLYDHIARRASVLTIVVDDLHHSDLPSIQLLDRVLRALRDRPILLVAFARPELARIFPGCFAERGRQELPLRELPASAIADLVRHARAAEDEATVATLVARSEGNPLVLEALLAEDEPTATLVARTVARGRLDGLDADVRRVARIAAVMPSAISSTSLRRVLDPAGDLESILAELVEQGVLAPGSSEEDTSERTYVFASEVVRDAAAAMVPEDDRAFVVSRASAQPRAAARSRA